MKFNDLQHDDPMPTYVALVKAIEPLSVAYVHVLRTGIGAEGPLREAYKGKMDKPQNASTKTGAHNEGAYQNAASSLR